MDAELAALTCPYYVAPGGNDGAAGTLGAPWGTFRHAADNAAPGNTIYFRGGTYPTAEAIYVSQPGTASSPITYIAYLNGKPVSDGGGSAGELLILEGGAPYQGISRFTLRGFTIYQPI